MSTSPIRVRPLAAAMCAALLALSTTAFAQTSATPPVGYMTYTLASGKSTPVGISLSESNVYTGPAASVTADSIGVSNVTWTANQFAAPGAPHFVNVMSGAQMGRTLLVTGNTANTVTVAAGDTALNTTGFALAAGDRVEIVPGDTLGSLFGGTTETVALQGGTSAATADNVQLFSGVRFVNYYFNSTLGHWVISGDSTNANQNNVVLAPYSGLVVLRRGPETSFVVTGRVPTTNLLTQLPSGGSFMAVRFPSDTTLGQLNLSAPGNWVANDSPALADTVGLWDGTRWVGYHKKADGQWYQTGGDGTVKNSLPIPAGTALSIMKRGSSTGVASFYAQALPYSLN